MMCDVPAIGRHIALSAMADMALPPKIGITVDDGSMVFSD
jgi:hypothetical protein